MLLLLLSTSLAYCISIFLSFIAVLLKIHLARHLVSFFENQALHPYVQVNNKFSDGFKVKMICFS